MARKTQVSCRNHPFSSVFLLFAWLISLNISSNAQAGGNPPKDPNDIKPIMIGQTLPPLPLQRLDGKSVDLKKQLEGKPALLIFYRGGWCPYCNTHLSDLRKIEDQLVAMGFEIYAISPDLPEFLKETAGKHEMGYSLLSDASMDSAKALGLAFEVDKATRDKYEEYGIDLERSSGKAHHLLPVPAAILVNDEGIVSFTFISPNYKIRVSNEVILAAAKVTADNSSSKRSE